MSKLHVIGIGGSGHKLVTSVIHLAACGAFKGQMGLNTNTIDQIRIVTIDADDSNGNLSLTRSTLSSYKQFYNALSAEAGLGLVPLESITPSTNISLFKEGKQNLNDVFTVHKFKDHDIDKLVRFLYTDDEIDDKFDQGFYGHTSIGTLIVKDILSSDAAWKQFLIDINANDFVVVMGSIFGGTGASAIPVVLEELNAKKKDASFKLATIILTPYFRAVGDILESGKLQPNSDNFQTKAKASLYYYYLQAQYKKTDALYVIGEPEVNFSAEAASRGSSRQRNKAHPLELFASSAIVDFIKESKNRTDGKIITADRETNGSGEYYYTWKMVQNIDSGLPQKIQKLTKIAIFYNKVLYGQYTKQSVAGDYDKDICSEKDDEQNFIYENIRGYLVLFVNWIYELHKRNLDEIDQNNGRMKWTPDTRVKLFNASYPKLFDNVPFADGESKIDKFNELVYNDTNPKFSEKVYADFCSVKPVPNTGKRFAALFATLGELFTKPEKRLFGGKIKITQDNFVAVPYLSKENNVTFTRPDSEENKLWSKSEPNLLINIADGLPNVQTEKFERSDVSIPSPWSIFIVNELTLSEPKFATLNKSAYNQWCGLIALLVLRGLRHYDKAGLTLKQLDTSTVDCSNFLNVVRETLVPTNYIFDNPLWTTSYRISVTDGVTDETIAFLSHNTIVCPAYSYSAEAKQKLHNMAPTIVDEDGKFMSPDNYFKDQSQSINRDAKYALKLFLDSLKSIITAEAAKNPRSIIKSLQNLVEKYIAELGTITPNPDISLSLNAPIKSVFELFDDDHKIKNNSATELPFLLDNTIGVNIALVGLNICGINSSSENASTISVTNTLLYNRINSLNIQDIIRKHSGEDNITLVHDQELLLDSMVIVSKNGESVFHSLANSKSIIGDYEVVWPVSEKLLSWFNRVELNKMLSVRGDMEKITVTLELKLKGKFGNHTVTKEYKLKTANDVSSGNTESGVCTIFDKNVLPLWAVWPYKEIRNSRNENIWKRYNFFCVDFNEGLIFRGATVLEIEAFFGAQSDVLLGVQKLSTISNDQLDISYKRFKALPQALKINLKSSNRTNYTGAILLQEASHTQQGNVVWNVGLDFGTTTTTAFYSLSGSESTPEFIQLIDEYFWVDGSVTPQKIEKKNDIVILSNAGDKKNNLEQYFIDPKCLKQKAYTTAYEIMDTTSDNADTTVFQDGRIFWHNYDNFRMLNMNIERRDRLLTNIKWETGKIIYAGKYLNQLLTQMVYSAAEKGIKQINWYFSYPTAFSREARKDFSDCLSSLIKSLKDDTGIDIVFNEKQNLITESIAASYYFGKNNPLQQTFLCVDIGGNSSDVSIWIKNNNIFQTSIRFASRDMFITPLEKLLSRPSVMETVRTKDNIDGIYQMLEYGGKENTFSKDKIKYFIETVLFEYNDKFKTRLRSLTGEDEQAYKKFKYSVCIAYSGLVYYLSNIIAALLSEKKIANDITQIVFGLSGKGSKLTDWIAYCPEIYAEAEKVILNKGGGIQIKFLDQFNVDSAKTETAIGMICDLDAAGNQNNKSIPSDPSIFLGSKIDIAKGDGIPTSYTKDVFIDPYAGVFVNPQLLHITVEKDLSDFGEFLEFFNRIATKSRGDMPLIPMDWYEAEKQTLWNQIKAAFENTLEKEKRFDPPFIVMLKVFLDIYGNADVY
ncbi:MAG: hypothetical protein Ta2F_17300 [Termitinemataceae bacterium]|nr:MAG: hypothetical protein Ta2F_17300 [Termitinemataceae bacterium]